MKLVETLAYCFFILFLCCVTDLLKSCGQSICTNKLFFLYDISPDLAAPHLRPPVCAQRNDTHIKRGKNYYSKAHQVAFQ